MANKPLDTTLLDRAIIFAVRAPCRDYAQQGDALWDLFHAKDPKDHEWHYRGQADALCELRDTFAYREFENLINQVFAG